MIARYLTIIAVMIAALFAGPQAAEAKIHHYLFGTYDDGIYPAVKKVQHKKHRKHVKLVKIFKVVKHVKVKHYAVKKKSAMKAKRGAPLAARVVVAKPAYQGRELVHFASKEKPGTIIINTKERSLYEILGSGKAMRYYHDGGRNKPR